MMRTRSCGALVLGLLLVHVAGIAHAQVSWVVADRDATQISTLVSKLEPFVEKLPGQKDAAAVVLFSQLQTRVENGKAEMCRNLMLQVRDASDLNAELVSPWVSPGVELSHFAAFVMHDGAKREVAETAITLVDGDEEYQRTHCQVDWGEVKKGDVIGWSWVGELDQNPPALSFAVANVYPTVISNLTLDGGGDYVYEFLPVGFAPKKLSLKEREVIEGEPSLWKASVNAMEAVDAVPVEAPYPDSVPHIAAALKKVWFEREGAPIQPQWLEMGDLNSLAQSLQSIAMGAEKDADKLDILLTALTTGKSTDAEKIESVFRHVQQKVTLLEGSDVAPRAIRDEGLMKAKSVTPAEKVVMMTVLLHKLDIPASVALVHTPALGEFDENRTDWLQFDAFAVRTGSMEEGAFYVPQCADCEPGGVPADWSGGTALIAPANVLELSREFGEAQQKKAMNAGSFNLGQMRREQAEQPWHKLVKLGD